MALGTAAILGSLAGVGQKEITTCVGGMTGNMSAPSLQESQLDEVLSATDSVHFPLCAGEGGKWKVNTVACEP